MKNISPLLHIGIQNKRRCKIENTFKNEFCLRLKNYNEVTVRHNEINQQGENPKLPQYQKY